VAVRAPVFAVPLGDSLPDQPPEAVQLVTPVADQVSVEVVPLVTEVGLALRVKEGLEDVASSAVTAMLKAGSVAVVAPSVALITMLESVPTLSAVGVPLNSPLVVSNFAHWGGFWMRKFNELLAGAAADGLNV
jgi:hypothetical protein